ncbi:YbjN domain-containing protein [Qipengyuania sediminis]|uniref:YbjN domain-containing protein n=1 Tax=Qipengyuania sediminis TaxID=1532023 RepID=UPI00105A9F94|nr:YbjN domain-containing protein [Qipengyuania sediminis]
MKAQREERFAADEEAAPLAMLAALFRAHGWPCENQADELTGTIEGSWTTYTLKCLWRGDDAVLQVIALPDIRVPDDKRPAAHELLALVNEQMWVGHFDLWSNGGTLLYRNAALLGGEGLLGLAQAQALVENAVEECDRFYPAFQFVLWGGKHPRDALAAAMVDAAGEA